MNHQMKTQKMRITCLNCKKSSLIQIINDTEVIYIDQMPIISCRLRGDMQWGFECICGNDSRLCREELKDINILVKASSKQTIQKIADSLKIKDERKFKMEEV